MNKKFLCVFDLDGTLYPKESKLTYEIRKRVIQHIASINSISMEVAEALYKELPTQYPNPYDGLESLNVSGALYQEVFNSVDIENYIHPDTRLISLFQQLSRNADIFIVSFAPTTYVKRMLTALGVNSSVKTIMSVGNETSYSKVPIFNAISNHYNYDIMFSIGDDRISDLVPAEKVGFQSFLVNFDNEGFDIYSIMNKLNDIMNRRQIPRIMRVENISICNEKCIICPYEKMKRTKGEMTDTLFEKIIMEHAFSVDHPKLIFPASIGEPFLDRHFLEKVSFARKYYTDIATFSNASMLSKELFIKYVQCGGTELMLTLHGFTENMHSYITKTRFYNIVRSNIETIAETNNSLGCPVTLFLDIYAESSDECLTFIGEMIAQGVTAQRIDLEHTHNWGGRIIQFSKKETHNHCPRIYEQFGVQYDGTVVPCCIDIEGDYILGNASTQSLREIFSSEKYNQLIHLEKQGFIRNNTLCTLCNI